MKIRKQLSKRADKAILQFFCINIKRAKKIYLKMAKAIWLVINLGKDIMSINISPKFV